MTELRTHQRGFTLIEMSIVLVIIGLIIGGILKGQELIESARQKNVISQIDSIKAGANTFQDRFKSLPGDFNRTADIAAAGLTAGDGNGYIGAQNATTVAMQTLVNTIGAENEQFFVHLIAANMLGGGSVTTVATACFSGLCATASPQPASAFPNSGLSLQYGFHTGLTADAASNQIGHWIIVSKWANAALTGGTADGVISPARAYQLDNKYDDGIASTGNIRTLSLGTSCGSLTTTYVTTENAANCHLAVNTGF